MTEIQEMDELPWGSALIPEWWSELTPHHTIDVEEVEEQRRRELARIAALQAQFSGDSSFATADDDGSLLTDVGAAGPYALPGFKGADGINDASFIGPGNKKWCITPQGHFYDPQEPDVRYTAPQMAESGHIPPGMEEEFASGWDRSQTSKSPVDTSMYARAEKVQWKKPDWMKNTKLRSTDQGAAIRHGLYEMEGKLEKNKRRYNDDTGSEIPSASASPATVPSASPSPVLGYSNRKTTPSEILANSSAHSGQAASPLTVSSWQSKTKKEEPAKAPPSSSPEKPSWAKHMLGPTVAQAEAKPEEMKPTGHTKPFWVKPKVEERKSPIPPDGGAKNEEDESEETEAPPWTRPSWEKPKEESKSEPPIKKDEDKGQEESKPAAPPQQPAEPIKTKLNLKAKATVPTSLQSVAVAAHPPAKAAPTEESKEQPKVVQDKQQEESTSDEIEEDEVGNLVSQGLVLKLMILPDDASRAKELRDKIAPTPESNGKVLVKPDELLIAIAHHATNWKHDSAQKAKIDSLRQIAIIARLVIMKLYGSGSPELKQFEDGLRPAFAT